MQISGAYMSKKKENTQNWTLIIIEEIIEKKSYYIK